MQTRYSETRPWPSVGTKLDATRKLLSDRRWHASSEVDARVIYDLRRGGYEIKSDANRGYRLTGATQLWLEPEERAVKHATAEPSSPTNGSNREAMSIPEGTPEISLDGRVVLNLITEKRANKTGKLYYSTPGGRYGFSVREQDLPRGLDTQLRINNILVETTKTNNTARGVANLGGLLGEPTVAQWYIAEHNGFYQIKLVIRRKGGSDIHELSFAN